MQIIILTACHIAICMTCIIVDVPIRIIPNPLTHSNQHGDVIIASPQSTAFGTPCDSSYAFSIQTHMKYKQIIILTACNIAICMTCIIIDVPIWVIPKSTTFIVIGSTPAIIMFHAASLNKISALKQFLIEDLEFNFDIKVNK